MKEDLFETINRKNDKFWIVKDALNVVGYQGFPRAVGYWLRGIGYGADGGGVDFPEDDDIFEGVRCYSWENNEVIVSEQVFFEHLKAACQRYIELYPDRRDELKQIISQSTLV